MQTSNRDADASARANVAADTKTTPASTSANKGADAASNERGRASRRAWPRRIAQIVGVLVALGLVNGFLSWALGPYGTNTQIIWWAYRDAADEPIDTILAGSSYCMSGFDPAAIDKSLGSTSFSLCTASQALEDSYDAIQTAIEDHHVKRAVLGVEYGIFTSTPAVQTASTILQAQNQSLSPLGQATNIAKVMTRPYFRSSKASFECLCPWSFNHVDLTPEAIGANVKNRLECPNPIEAGKRYMPAWIYAGQGYFEIFGPLDYDQIGNTYPPYEEGSQPFLDDRWAQLSRILELCSQNDVTLYVVVMPQPAFNVLRYGRDYPQAMSRLQQAVEADGATYMDFNLALASTYQSDPYDFSDNEHMDTNGARRFCPVLGATIRELENGTDEHDLFYGYDQWDEWLASIDYISLTGCYNTVTEDSVELEAWSLAGSNVQIEYEVSVVTENGTSEVVRPYDVDPTFSWPTTDHGVATFCVRARQVGSDGDPERSCTFDVYY